VGETDFGKAKHVPEETLIAWIQGAEAPVHAEIAGAAPKKPRYRIPTAFLDFIIITSFIEVIVSLWGTGKLRNKDLDGRIPFLSPVGAKGLPTSWGLS